MCLTRGCDFVIHRKYKLKDERLQLKKQDERANPYDSPFERNLSLLINPAVFIFGCGSLFLQGKVEKLYAIIS